VGDEESLTFYHEIVAEIEQIMAQLFIFLKVSCVIEK